MYEFNKIAIIGLGYVGLPLCIRFAEAGISVIGLDVDVDKTVKINDGKSYINHISEEHIKSALETGRLEASTEFNRISEVQVVIICVPTPLNKHREPDISYVLDSGSQIGKFITRNTLVVLESTTYPGTTDTDLRTVIETESKFTAGKDFFLAYSPEREDPGRKDHSVQTIPKVVGGYTEECRNRCVDLYSRALDKIFAVSTCRVAEATKLTENIFRSVNIALVNELKLVFQKMNIDIWEVIDAASSKPFGYMPFYPGPGLGGHCIPIDPFYLTWKAREYGMHTRFIELAGEMNDSMMDHTVNKTAEALNYKSKAVMGSRILVLGLAYKSDVDDMRESPSFGLLDRLRSRGATLDYYDPYIPIIGKTREHEIWQGMKSVYWNEEQISSYDAVLIATKHSCVDYKQLAEWCNCIIDSRNAMKGIATQENQVTTC